MPYTPTHSYTTHYTAIKRDIIQSGGGGSGSCGSIRESLPEVCTQAPPISTPQPIGDMEAEPIVSSMVAARREVQLLSAENNCKEIQVALCILQRDSRALGRTQY